MGISNKSQQVVEDAAWYYEAQGSITLIVWPKDLPQTRDKHSYYDAQQGVVHLRIPSKMLLATLERQGKAKPVKRPAKKK
jgi:hypothetical protein